jgi:hypothetical protein
MRHFATMLRTNLTVRFVTALTALVVLTALAAPTTTLAQPRNLVVVNNAATAPLTSLQLGVTYSLRWDTTAAPANTRYRVQFSSEGQNGPWADIVVRNTSTQLSEPLIITDGAAGNAAPGAGSRSGRGISRLTLRFPRASAMGFVRLLDTANTTNVAVSSQLTIVQPPPPVAPDSVLRGSIGAGTTLTLSNTKIYGLDGYVYVDAGAVLRILPGTVILGDTVGQNSALCVNRGGILFAQGTSTSPIVLTSSSPAGQRRRGDWGGLLIAGRARVNTNPSDYAGTSVAFEGGIADEGRVRGWYGGNDDNDSSGVLRYVRVEFGGIAAFPNEELNGITLGGVGRRTVFQYVQSSFANDDGIEWFGGTVNGKWLISNGAIDDDFDTDFGFSGRVQYGLIVRDPQVADQSTSQAFESDNDAAGSFNQPYTSAIFSNITAIGPLSDTAQVSGSAAGTWSNSYGSAAQIRRNSRQSIVNSVFVGWPRAGIELQSQRTQAAALADSLLIRNNLWFGIKGVSALGLTNSPLTLPLNSGEAIPVGMGLAWLTNPAFRNEVVNQAGSVDAYDEIAAAFGPSLRSNAFDPRPATSRDRLLTRASFARPSTSSVAINDSFFTTVPFSGAFNAGTGVTNRWDLPWAEYDPVSFPYAANAPTSRTAPFGIGTGIRSNTLDYTALDVVVFPLPVQDVSTVRYNLVSASRVSVRVINALGAEVLSVLAGLQQAAGVYEFPLSAQTLAPGAYMVQIVTQTGVAVQKLTVVR